MRIWLLIFILFFSFAPKQILAQDWEDFADLDKPWEAQKDFSNQKYEQVIDALEQKKKKQETKKRKKLFKKISGGGTSLHEELNPDNQVQEIDVFTKKEDLLLNVSVDIVLNNTVLDRGFYKILAEKDDNNNIVINFYQSQYLKGSVIATETDDDYGQDKIDFVDILPYNESFLKLIFGSLDFNAYAYIPFLEN